MLRFSFFLYIYIYRIDELVLYLDQYFISYIRFIIIYNLSSNDIGVKGLSILDLGSWAKPHQIVCFWFHTFFLLTFNPNDILSSRSTFWYPRKIKFP